MARGRPSREEVYSRLDTQILELWTRLGGLPSPLEARDVWDGIWFEEAHHSTAIEGNTLRQDQVEDLLARGQAVGNKQLSEYLEVKGYGEASKWVYGAAMGEDRGTELITMQDIREIHHRAMSPLWEVLPPEGATAQEGPGSFRQSEIRAFKEGMKPPTHPIVHARVQEWVEKANKLQPRSELFAEEVAALHCEFEQIHPFFDGNGRAGRLVLNLLLVRMGYPPAVIYAADRTKYLKALRSGDKGEFGPLGEFIARALLANLYKFIVPAVAGPARLVPLAALETEDISATALRVAAHRGVLEATKGADGQWRSSKNWVDEYLANRYRRSGGPV